MQPIGDFGNAIRAMKEGARVCRAGWNGKGMWLALSPGNPRLEAGKFWAGPNRAYAQENGGSAPVLPCITMKTATGEILMGWLASQTDMLAEDWHVLDGEGYLLRERLYAGADVGGGPLSEDEKAIMRMIERMTPLQARAARVLATKEALALANKEISDEKEFALVEANDRLRLAEMDPTSTEDGLRRTYIFFREKLARYQDPDLLVRLYAPKSIPDGGEYKIKAVPISEVK